MPGTIAQLVNTIIAGDGSQVSSGASSQGDVYHAIFGDKTQTPASEQLNTQGAQQQQIQAALQNRTLQQAQANVAAQQQATRQAALQNVQQQRRMVHPAPQVQSGPITVEQGQPEPDTSVPKVSPTRYNMPPSNYILRGYANPQLTAIQQAGPDGDISPIHPGIADDYVDPGIYNSMLGTTHVEHGPEIPETYGLDNSVDLTRQFASDAEVETGEPAHGPLIMQRDNGRDMDLTPAIHKIVEQKLNRAVEEVKRKLENRVDRRNEI